MDKLKPCPFCGHKEIQFTRDFNQDVNGIYCRGCKAFVQFPMDYKPTASYGTKMDMWADKWNKRTS